MIKKICIIAICVLTVSVTRCSCEKEKDTDHGYEVNFNLRLNNLSYIDYHLYAKPLSMHSSNKIPPGGYRTQDVIQDRSFLPQNIIVQGGQNGIIEKEILIPVDTNSSNKIAVYFDGQNLTYQFIN